MTARWTRRRLFGASASALGAGALGTSGLTPGARASSPAGAGGDLVRRLQSGVRTASFPEPPAGTIQKVVGPSSYQGATASGSSGVILVEAIFVASTEPSGAVTAPIDLPVGSHIRRVDFTSYVSPGYPDLQQALVLATSSSPSLSVSEVVTTSFPAGADESTVQRKAVTADYIVTGGISLTLYNTMTSFNAWSPDSSVSLGAIVHYVPPARSFVPVTPFRVYDTRWNDFGPRYTGNSSRVVSVADARNSSGAVTRPDAVPAGAVAITFNITAINTSGSGLLSVTPGTSGSYSTATLNWATAGNTLGNASTVAIDTNRRVKIFSSGAATAGAHVTLDVTGFYI
jgi:hypothetical protein